VCIYNCKDKVKCEVYYKNYEAIMEEPIEEKYITKYGNPIFPVPNAIAEKARIAEKKERELAKLQLAATMEEKRRTKQKAKQDKENEKEEKRKIRAFNKEQKLKKKKRKRRTKEEILLANQIVVPTPVLVEPVVGTKKRGRPAKKVEEKVEINIKKPSMASKFEKMNFFGDD
jgi:hypothetical protein